MQAEYRFRFSEDHLLTSLLRFRQQVWWRKPFIGLKWILGLTFAIPLVIFVYKGIPALAGIFGAIVGALLLGWPIDAWIVRRRFRKSPFHDDEIVFSISERGSHVVGRNSETLVGWANFTKARRFKDGLLLFQGPNVVNWLPDVAASDAGAVKNAQEMARLHIPDYREV
jgi:hypothetical protein